ncbi:MAG: hypothetical protein CV087_02500 [Candidatus Brocadia sp. WS118]|nr:MAG: hypothetical protein CV087_02500 [Candidatus Brocadia sp. WS118]
MQNRTFHIFLFLCIAAIGCYATIAQVILIREFLNVFYGNELCLGIVFGAWFLGIASGAFAGAKVEHAFRHVFSVFIITLFVLCLVLPVQILFIRGMRGFLRVGIGEYISLIPLLLTSFGFILPLSFIIGFIFPFSSKVVWGVTRDAAIDIGIVYIVESMGSLVGGLVFSFFMVSRFHPFKIIALLNVGMFVLLTFLSFYSRGKENTAKRILSLVSLGFVLAMLVVLFSSVPDKVEALSTKIRWNTLNPHIELVASADSKYQHIDIGKQADQYSIYLNGQYAAAFPNEYEYAQVTHLVMTQHPSPKQVLLIGNGLGGIISEMLLYPIESLDYVELDQDLLQISGRYLSPSDKQALSDRRVTVFHQDGRYYVKNTSKKQHYDIILVNTPDPATAFLNRFYTREFFQEAQTILKSDGVLAASVSSAVTYIGKEVGSYTGSLYRTLHETFQQVLVTPGQTNFYFACNEKGIITPDIETLMGRYRRFQVTSGCFTEYLFYTLLQPEQVAFIERQLSRREDLPVNTDARPVTYFLNLVLWDSLIGGRLHGFFQCLKNAGIQSFLVPILMILAGRVMYLLFRPWREFNPYFIKQLKTHYLIALATTGFAGIALEMVLLYAFQNIYGYIYERMGVIIAVFMVGLALGGYLMNQIIKKIRNPKSEIPNNSLQPAGADSYHGIKILLVIQGIIGCYALVLPFFIHLLSSYSIAAEVGLTCLIGIAGILTGMEFPLVNKILIQHSQDIAISAGVTNSADHVGAFLGALLTGVIFIPLFGIFGTCLILAVLNIVSLILIVFSLVCRKRSN